MLIKKHYHLFIVLSLCMLFVLPVQAADTATSSNDPGLAALEAASQKKEFLMVLFQKTSEPSPLTTSFETVAQSLAGSVSSIVVNLEAPEEKGLVEKYNVRFAPMPIVVMLAPNGAVTGNFRKEFTQNEVEQMMVTPKTQECLLAFQQQKLVLLCVQGKDTTGNSEAMKGVTQFKEDPKFTKFSEVVMLDPSDAEEQPLLGQLQINENTSTAETLLLAPPGQILGKWSGATSKDAITRRLMAQMSAKRSCKTPNCADPNCGPKKGATAKGGVN